MNKNIIIIVILSTVFSIVYGQCDENKCYLHYKNLLSAERGNAQQIFDSLLEKYGNVDGNLRNLLEKLNNSIERTDKNLTSFKKLNEDVHNQNNKSNETLQNLLKELDGITDKIKTIGNRPKTWVEELDDANRTADLIANSEFTTLNEIDNIEKELQKWYNDFLKENNPLDLITKNNNITSIPHSVSEDLTLLETLLEQNYDTSCFEKFREDLKLLFAQLANILSLNVPEEEIENIRKKSIENRKKADEILAKTKDILKREKDLENIKKLLDDTLNLTKDIDNMKKDIDRILKNDEELYKDKLGELEKAHNDDLEALFKKYNTDDLEPLLEELKDVNDQIKGMNDGKLTTVSELEKEMGEYLEDIEYYTCILNDCRYRQPAEATTNFNCVKKNNA